MQSYSSGPIIVERNLERRRAARYELTIPVAFLWADHDGSALHAEGVTRDISDIGVYVLADKCPPLNSEVRVEVMAVEPGIASAFLKGNMKVLRVEVSPDVRGGCGFALAGSGLSIEAAGRGNKYKN